VLHYLRETADTSREAEQARTRLLNQVDERRQPRSKATVGMLLDRWLEVSDVDASTSNGYRSKIETHIRPTPGHFPLAKVDAEVDLSRASGSGSSAANSRASGDDGSRSCEVSVMPSDGSPALRHNATSARQRGLSGHRPRASTGPARAAPAPGCAGADTPGGRERGQLQSRRCPADGVWWTR
jgi:hypothetical protein